MTAMTKSMRKIINISKHPLFEGRTLSGRFVRIGIILKYLMVNNSQKYNFIKDIVKIFSSVVNKKLKTAYFLHTDDVDI